MEEQLRHETGGTQIGEVSAYPLFNLARDIPVRKHALFYKLADSWKLIFSRNSFVSSTEQTYAIG
jgi:hypothetical protein